MQVRARTGTRFGEVGTVINSYTNPITRTLVYRVRFADGHEVEAGILCWSPVTEKVSMQMVKQPSLHERQLLQAALMGLEYAGYVMCPANMVNALMNKAEQDSHNGQAECGLYASSKADIDAVYAAMQNDANTLCWVRLPKVINKLRQRGGVEIESVDEWENWLRTYRAEGLEWADEIELFRYVFYSHITGTLLAKLNADEQNRYWTLVERGSLDKKSAKK